MVYDVRVSPTKFSRLGARSRGRALRGLFLFCLLVVPLHALAKTPTPQMIPLASFAPKEPPLAKEGEGLCAAFRVDRTDYLNIVEFAEGPGTEPLELWRRLNDYIDRGQGQTAQDRALKRRVDFTVSHLLDLSNGIDNGLSNGRGDYVGFACEWGCPFSPMDFLPGEMKLDYFGARYRGFLNVPDAWAGRQLYMGLFANDAAYVAIFDAPSGRTPILIMTTGTRVGTEQLRVLNRVTFPKGGLYPIEVGHAQSRAAAALEVTLYDGDQAPPPGFKLPSLNDPGGPAEFWSEQDVQNVPRPKLSEWPGMTLLAPRFFFQSRTGFHPYKDVMQCQQCPRNLTGQSGSGTACGTNYYCNEAGLCDLCATAEHCGPQCQPCSGATPVCDGEKCVPCVENTDCAPGSICSKNECVPCASDSSCGGASCNCCPDGTRCLESVAQKGRFLCGRCRADADCMSPDLRCDTASLLCVPASQTLCPQGTSELTERCGAECAPCPMERRLCQNGKVCVACRADDDCAAGNYCNSGDCVPCITDKRCGPRCGSCTASLPFCFHPQDRAADARCVECLTDDHCGAGGKCDQATLTCAAPCKMCETSPDGRVCSGSQCVQCLTDAHCPCGQSCDVKSGQCDPACKDNTDCTGAECCSRSTGECKPGRCKPGVGVLCCEVGRCGEPGDSGESRGGAAAGATALVVLGLLLRRRRPGPTKNGDMPPQGSDRPWR